MASPDFIRRWVVGSALTGVKSAARVARKAIPRSVKRKVPIPLIQAYASLRGAAMQRALQWSGAVHAAPDAAHLARIRTELARSAVRPLISIVMPTYNSNAVWLRSAIQSVRAQLYETWELCICDDGSTDATTRSILKALALEEPRIRLHFSDDNRGIALASQAALDMTTGEFVCFLDHDDELAVHALYYVVKEIESRNDVALVYSDEDKIDPGGRLCQPYFKPDWNPDLLLSHNLITHLAAYRTSIVRELGGFREGYDGAQDYDLALRFTARVAPDRIRHVPRLLYHWRMHSGSTAAGAAAKPDAAAAARRAIADQLRCRGVDADVLAAPGTAQCHRVRYRVPTPAPLVSIVIPTRNQVAVLKTCIESIRSLTDYPNFELIVVDNGSDEPEALRYLDAVAHDGATVLRDPGNFNFPRLVNAGVAHARGEFVCLLNNDIEVLSPGWLTEMVGHAARKEIGIVGARLWYPNGTLQHGGVILGIGGVAGHAHKRLRRGVGGYANRAILIQNFSAVTGACLVTRTSIYRDVGGFDEALSVAFNDVDFCLKVRATGYRVLWTPYAELVHHESLSRGRDMSDDKKARMRREVETMTSRWSDLIASDPAYSPHLTRIREDFSFAWPPPVI